jgi:hypothetical protein
MTAIPDPTHCTYRVAWSVEDGEHVATVAEFPSLSWLAPAPVEALTGLADVVRDVPADLAASGDPVPVPLPARSSSGRFVVRVPAEAHCRLVREAAEQHVSPNRLVSGRLARASSLDEVIVGSGTEPNANVIGPLQLAGQPGEHASGPLRHGC